MPIEIKELHIKAVVQEDPPPALNASGITESTSVNQINAIVAQCVEQVLNILKEKQER